jgi:predicted kinase
LVVIRGNSGSGKTTIAREVRRRYGRGCALIEQDQCRRIVLREHEGAGFDPVAPQFIADAVRSALRLGYHVLLEGILYAEFYGTVLRRLMAEHRGPSHVFYLDVPLAETLRRHHLPDVVRSNRNSTLRLRSQGCRVSGAARVSGLLPRYVAYAPHLLVSG